MRSYLSKVLEIPRECQPIIIGITGHVEDKFIQEGMMSGMDRVCSKPFYSKSFKDILQEYN